MSTLESAVQGKLVIMGEIVTKEPDSVEWTHPMALLITFDSAEAIRKAISDGVCRFTWAEPARAAK